MVRLQTARSFILEWSPQTMVSPFQTKRGGGGGRQFLLSSPKKIPAARKGRRYYFCMTPFFKIDFGGISRTVFLVGPWAFKFPTARYGWAKFLAGLLANMQETTFSRARWPELCPVLASVPGGFLVVMPRVRVMTDEEFERFDYLGFVWTPDGDRQVPVEAKSDSFGWLDGRVVAIDYGN